MRQPAFRSDGALILVKGFRGFKTSLWTIDANTGAFGRQQSPFSDDLRPAIPCKMIPVGGAPTLPSRLSSRFRDGGVLQCLQCQPKARGTRPRGGSAALPHLELPSKREKRAHWQAVPCKQAMAIVDRSTFTR
jgi:hypothetical protein